ncbi:hypothetical protein ACFXG4_37740 [Nocardia sp. NPDC059246]|uniref:hypothetical protein n=1 Tax=unclassified Nocardia TaxID=2637762 RepID=UPI0036AA3687
MRIFRDYGDEHDDHDDEQPRKGFGRDEIAAQADLLADEIADFLSDTAGAADQRPPVKPTLRLVPPLTAPEQATASAPVETGEPALVPVVKPHTRGQIWRASAAGSFVVVGLAAVTAWGQPFEVGVPVAVYGLGWIAYLSWSAARRPSPTLALAAFTEHRAARAHRNTH